MTSPIVIILLCTLAWSGLDVLRKVLSAKISALALVFYLTLGQIPVLAIWAIGHDRPTITVDYVAVASAAIALNILANVAFTVAVRVSPLSLTVPLLSLTPVFTTLFAIPIVGEVPSRGQTFGILLVVVGALGLGLASGEGRALDRLRALLRERGSWLMVVVAAGWSLSMPLDKIGVLRVGEAWHALVLSAGVALGTLGLVVASGALRELAAPPRGTWPTLLAAIGAGSAALVLQLAAIHVAMVGLVEGVKRGVGNFLALVLGRVLFGEPVTAAKIGAVLVMAVGVAVLLIA